MSYSSRFVAWTIVAIVKSLNLNSSFTLPAPSALLCTLSSPLLYSPSLSQAAMALFNIKSAGSDLALTNVCKYAVPTLLQCVNAYRHEPEVCACSQRREYAIAYACFRCLRCCTCFRLKISAFAYFLRCWLDSAHSPSIMLDTYFILVPHVFMHICVMSSNSLVSPTVLNIFVCFITLPLPLFPPYTRQVVEQLISALALPPSLAPSLRTPRVLNALLAIMVEHKDDHVVQVCVDMG
jgi:hypothetical protein